MIHLLDDYYVDIDNGTFTLFRLIAGKNKDGQPTESRKVIGYYGTLQKCLRRCACELLADRIDGRIIELREAINIINENVNRLEKLFEREGIE